MSTQETVNWQKLKDMIVFIEYKEYMITQKIKDIMSASPEKSVIDTESFSLALDDYNIAIASIKEGKAILEKSTERLEAAYEKLTMIPK